MKRIMTARTTIAVAIVTGVLAAGLPGMAAPPAFAATTTNDFRDAFDGSTSWTENSGTWQVEGGEYSQAQTSGARFATLTDRRFGDAQYDIDLRAVDTGGDAARWAGIQFKKMRQGDGPFDSGFTVYVRANGELALYRVNQAIATASTGLSLSSTRHLRVTTSGSTIKVFIANETTPRITATDPSFASGAFGLVTYDSHWHFDNVAVTGAVLPYTVDVGAPQLLYADAQMPTHLDQSFATVQKNGTLYSYMVNGYDPTLYRFSGTPENPLQHLDWSKPNMQWIDKNGHDAGYGMYELWMPNFYQVSANELIAFTHIERYPGNEGRGLPEFGLGISYSSDGGESWEFCGEIIAPKNRRLNVGGTPYVINNGYVQLYFNDGVNNDLATPWPRHVAAARAPLAEVIAAARATTTSPWKKYVNGSWTGDPISSEGSAVIADVYGSNDAHADATFSTALNKYLMTIQAQNAAKLQLYSSTDGVTWSMEAIVDSATPGVEMMPYSSFIDPSGGAPDGHTVDGSFTLQHERKLLGDYEHDDLYRSSITITPSASQPFRASAGFSSTQGANQWRYEQRGAGSVYSELSWNATAGRWVGASADTLVSTTTQHPDVNASVRTWIAPQAGTVRITGQVAKAESAAGGDGVRAIILKGGLQLWPASGWTSVGPADSVGVSHDVTVTVAAGDKIRFLVDRNQTSSFDTTTWDPVVRYQ
jgi:hypothetical protein